MSNSNRDNKLENRLRMAFSVFITPTLLTVVLFFLVQFFNDQKDVKIQQNQILIELGKINTQLRANETQISKNSVRIDDNKKYLVERVENNQREILHIHKIMK